ncbi:MAG: toll/interleukin-1 receptor domain-containing protein [Alphaproteobacteria bacterium]|nr:toll/interleukin-1 receptor domain-containing protein [Alphaproteobacteria bacterium]MBF0335205.1 toll/interleukin-1 receptor domain-containing protein [Alphaproteobacteria bacterium]
MKIFISWSGPRSEALAKALREWFPLVLHYVSPWLSQSDIQAGERWGVEIAKELEASNFGVICVTRENVTSPWILFESGALAKSMQDGRVIPLLLDLDFKEISGPIAQFQAKKAEQDGIKDLVISLNKAASSPIPEPQLDKLFAALWVQLENVIASIPKSGKPSKNSRPDGEILEELVSGIRGIEMRIRDIVDDPSARRPRRPRVHPIMLVDFARHLNEGRGDPIILLMVASAFRDSAPWLYELAVEAYRALKAGESEVSARPYHKFVAAIELLKGSSFAEDLGIDKGQLKMVYDAIHEYGMIRCDEDYDRPRPSWWASRAKISQQNNP